MHKLKVVTLGLVTMTIILFTSCDAISDSLDSSNNAAKEEASIGEYEAIAAKINEIESKIEKLEHDRGVKVPDQSTEIQKEHHIVQTAVMAMMADNPAYTLKGTPCTIKAGTSGEALCFIENDNITLDDYLTGALSFSWVVDADGTVHTP